MGIYDRIMKDIFLSRRSRFLHRLAGRQPVSPATGEIGGMLGYHVDYFSELAENEYIHVEFQTAVHLKMHWRMVNYCVLLHKYAHSWKQNNAVIRQYLIYLGQEPSRMLEKHPQFGSPYEYETINLNQKTDAEYSFLSRSPYYGDRLLWLLIGETRTLGDWERCFVFICALQDEDERVLGLFQLGHLAALRIFKKEVQGWVREMNIGEALRDSGIGTEILAEVNNENTIDIVQRYLTSREEEELDDDEYKALVGMPADELNQIVMEFVSGSRHRKTLRYVSELKY